MTELACSATLVPAYTPRILDQILNRHASRGGDEERKVLVFILCGGSKASLESMHRFQEHLEDWNEDEPWVYCASIGNT